MNEQLVSYMVVHFEVYIFKWQLVCKFGIVRRNILLFWLYSCFYLLPKFSLLLFLSHEFYSEIIVYTKYCILSYSIDVPSIFFLHEYKFYYWRDSISVDILKIIIQVKIQHGVSRRVKPWGSVVNPMYGSSNRLFDTVRYRYSMVNYNITWH